MIFIHVQLFQSLAFGFLSSLHPWLHVLQMFQNKTKAKEFTVPSHSKEKIIPPLYSCLISQVHNFPFLVIVTKL